MSVLPSPADARGDSISLTNLLVSNRLCIHTYVPYKATDCIFYSYVIINANISHNAAVI